MWHQVLKCLALERSSLSCNTVQLVATRPLHPKMLWNSSKLTALITTVDLWYRTASSSIKYLSSRWRAACNSSSREMALLIKYIWIRETTAVRLPIVEEVNSSRRVIHIIKLHKVNRVMEIIRNHQIAMGNEVQFLRKTLRLPLIISNLLLIYSNK